VLDYRKAALIDKPVRVGVNQLQKVAGIRRVQPPRLAIKATFCRGQAGGRDSILAEYEFDQATLIFIGTDYIAVHMPPPETPPLYAR